jgi:hypothetical protein
MLDAAIETVAETTDRPVVHSDRGDHYRWPRRLSRIADAKLIRFCAKDIHLITRRANASPKTELFYPRNCQSTAVEQFIQAVDFCLR